MCVISILYIFIASYSLQSSFSFAPYNNPAESEELLKMFPLFTQEETDSERYSDLVWVSLGGANSQTRVKPLQFSAFCCI